MKHFAFVLALGVWTLMAVCSLWWNLYAVNTNTRQTALNVGRSFFQEIEITRLWNAGHGGVYVRVTPETQPNPYLDGPDRDLRSTNGIELTNINPAFMTRQISALAEAEADIRYHLTSRLPIRPENRADAWETRALEQFESGAPEVLEFFAATQEFRYMAPLRVNDACLPCHAKQGYVAGDVRGGLSVTMPGAPYVASANVSKWVLRVAHAVFWTVGALGLAVFRKVRETQVVTLDRKNQELRAEIDARETVEQHLIRARDAAREAQREAEAANAVKSAFLANVSHEIRTPMTAILGFTDILLHHAETPEQRDYLHAIRTSGQALITLWDDILDLSKLEARKLALTPKPTNPAQILADIRDLLLPEVQAKGLRFALALDPDMPEYLVLDRIRLKQLLLSLIGNAVKFTDKGEVTVTARCEPRVPASEHSTPATTLHIAVADTGIGIPADRQRLIFDLFRQHDEQENRRYGGAGIGLALVKRLLDLMAGTLRVESQIGQGSVFHLTLPDVPVARDREYPLLDAVDADDRPDFDPAALPQFAENLAPVVGHERLAEAAQVLEDQLLPQWQAVRKLLVISDALAFGQAVGAVGEAFGLPGVSAYGRRLSEQARRYDIVALETVLDAFPELLATFRSYANHEGAGHVTSPDSLSR